MLRFQLCIFLPDTSAVFLLGMVRRDFFGSYCRLGKAVAFSAPLRDETSQRREWCYLIRIQPYDNISVSYESRKMTNCALQAVTCKRTGLGADSRT